jgi:hypothetical protein
MTDDQGLPTAERIAALAALGPHLVTSWGLGGVFHRRCSCGVGTPPSGALTAETAEGFVAACRAAQDQRDDAARTGRPLMPVAAAQDAQGDRTDLPSCERTDQNVSDELGAAARLPSSVAMPTGSES